jgi:hypothetical protein
MFMSIDTFRRTDVHAELAAAGPCSHRMNVQAIGSSQQCDRPNKEAGVGASLDRPRTAAAVKCSAANCSHKNPQSPTA